MTVPPPHGMSDVEYDAIEAAVAETARGRRFLAELARRSRVAETRQLLDAMARLEVAVAGGKTAPPSASMRLLAQRAKEIAARLGDIAEEMRADGVDEHLSVAVAAESRAVAGLMRTATSAPGDRPSPEAEPRAPLQRPAVALPPAAVAPQSDPRLAALAAIDGLTREEKLTLFR